MIPKVKELKAVSSHEVQIVYDDGVTGKVSLSDVIGKGVFAPLKEESFFKKVYIHPESGAIAWSDKLEIDPINVYLQITGKSIDQLPKAEYA